MSRVPSNGFNRSNSLFFGFVCQHGSINAITDGIDARHSCSKMLINFNATQFVGLDSQCLQAQTVSVGATASGNQDGIKFLLLGISSFRRLRCQFNLAITGNFRCHDFGFELKFESLLFECRLEFFGGFLIHARQQAVHKFNHSHLGSQSRPDGTHFQTNHSSSNNGHCLWDSGNVQSTSGIDNLLSVIVNGNGWQGSDFGSSGDKNVFGVQSLLSAFIQCHRDTIGSSQ
mmetsp:Transcript_1135/g.2504  ORF Transcript_1135/g.2504 Transcript_1135/m.2504 type:complete len:230 (+) Transcript_1135:1403-2092(+)